MKIEGYEEISNKEYNELRGYGGLYVDDNDSGKVRWFKKAQKFPIGFKIDLNHKVIIRGDGEVNFIHRDEIVFTVYPKEIPSLIEAVEKAKEVANKK